METLAFTLDDGTEVSFVVEEQTVVAGISYLLVSDPMDEGDNCYVLKDISDRESQEASYEFVEDDKELEAVFRIFQQIYDGEDTLLGSPEAKEE